MKKVLFIKNAAILTVSSLLLRLLGVVFKVWLAKEIGSEGIGLYQLIFSVYIFASTFANSGLSVAVTRLVADELSFGSRASVLKVFKRCMQLCLLLAFASSCVLFFSASSVSALLGDLRAEMSIRVLSFALPFMAISSCYRGFFLAERKASPSALSLIIEQLVRIFLVVFLVRRFVHLGLAVTCAAVFLGDTVSEAASAVFLWVLSLFDKKKMSSLCGRSHPPYKITRSILHIAAPITFGRYLNSLLRTFENILVPKALLFFGNKNALSLFGMIKGMALPLLFFPSALLNSLSTLLVPEISEAANRRQTLLVRLTTEKIIKITALVSFIFSCIFLMTGRKIGALIYDSDNVGFLLCALAPIVPFMYLDSVCDGILKGLDQQSFCFRTCILDSSLRIILIYFLVAKTGMVGFIAIMYFSNFLTCFLNVRRIIKISGAEISFLNSLFLPLCAALCVTTFIKNVFRLFSLNLLVYIILFCVLSISLYFLLIFLLGCIKKDDIFDCIPKRK